MRGRVLLVVGGLRRRRDERVEVGSREMSLGGGGRIHRAHILSREVARAVLELGGREGGRGERERSKGRDGGRREGKEKERRAGFVSVGGSLIEEGKRGGGEYRAKGGRTEGGVGRRGGC